MSKQLDTLSEDILSDLYKSWSVKNKKDLLKKLFDTKAVAYLFLKLSKPAKEVVYFALNEYTENMHIADIAFRLGYLQKQLTQFFQVIEEIHNIGFIYIKKKRRLLSQNDDTIFLIPDLKDTLLKILVDFPKEIFSRDYNTKIFKKYEDKIIALYKIGGAIYEDFVPDFIDEKIINTLYDADILSVYFTITMENKKPIISPYVALDNINVIAAIEKSIKSKIEQSVFKYNHYNILTDIDTFLYDVQSKRVHIDYSIKGSPVPETNAIFITEAVEAKDIYQILSSLNILCADIKNYVSINTVNLEKFFELDIDARYNYVIDNVYFEYKKIFSLILECLEDKTEKQKNIKVSSVEIFKYIKQIYDININYEYFEKALYYMYLLGTLEAGFHNLSITAIANIENSMKGKCIINGNFELTLINHKTFENDFIYLCSLYFNLEKQESVYIYKITEDSILRGKTLSRNLDSFNLLIKKVEIELHKNSLVIPKHLLTSIERWYKKVVRAKLFENVTIIYIKDVNKLEEIIYDAKRKGIIIEKINDEYAIIKSDTSKHVLIRFLRQKKIIISL